MRRVLVPDVVSGAALLALSVLYVIAARELPPGEEGPGPAFFPILLAAALFVLALSIAIEGRKTSEAANEAPRNRRALLLMALTTLYALFFSLAGTLFYTLGPCVRRRR